VTTLRLAYDVIRGVIFGLLLYYAIDRLIFSEVGGIVFRYTGY